MLFKDMRSLSCATPGTAAVCTSIGPRFIVEPRAKAAPPRRSHHGCSSTRRSYARASDARSSSCSAGGDTCVFSPPGSARYLLTDDGVAGGDAILEEVPSAEDSTVLAAVASPLKAASAAQAVSPPQEQIVVLRVSLHCKGCAGKVKKHLSKLEGVKSFEIDMAEKKVTVVGDLTPLAVLSSVSKVKNAQLWPSLPAAAAATV